MAMYGAIKPAAVPRQSTDEAVAAHFTGRRAAWRETCDRLITGIADFGSDAGAQPAKSYISLVRGGTKFAIVQVTSQRFDVGIKLKGTAPAGRLTTAGSWNAMVTHRVAVKNPGDVDPELLRWMRSAYDGAVAGPCCLGSLGRTGAARSARSTEDPAGFRP
ncbi:MAG TPA: DUF5655 domain-containing protein [Streptosporangiaceae bacterium]|nr:DUF5655 domain-containing protein [Streptosporangiaceae bacterium]